MEEESRTNPPETIVPPSEESIVAHVKEIKKRNREETLLVRRKIKEIASGYNVSDSFVKGLEKKVTQLIEESARRAFLNGRKTILDRDI